ncbi:MAG TPA: AAA family ATPase, partial [Puia sp.]|nr:AAA family ATPase [Puia sp.]
PLLVDPCKYDSIPPFAYDETGAVVPISSGGGQTISLLRLNRASHITRRIKARDQIHNLVVKLLDMAAWKDRKAAINYLQEIYAGNAGIEFLSFRQWMLFGELDEKPALARILGIEDERSKVEESYIPYVAGTAEILTNDFFPIEYIRIRNFKGISDLMIHFKENEIQQKSWLFLLGENGVGKSTILQALAIGIKADKALLKPMVPGLIQKGKPEAEITVKERNSDNRITTVLKRKNGSIVQTGVFNSFLLGYGSLRLSIEETKSSTKPKSGAKQDKARISYANLFNPVQPLNDITKWLKDIHKNKPDFFNAVAYSIKQLLPHDFADNELTVEKGQIMFRNSEKLFAELSDGFKSTIILAVDIMMKLSSAHADMDKMTGIVLIDELGNQLHPRWQMRIVKQLRTVFRNLNFIVSTHHPLCLRGAEREEILLLKNIESQVVPVTELPDPASLRVDQLLASEFFGLSSLIDPELEAKFNRYYELLAKEGSPDFSARAELNQLKDELRSRKQLGASLREELMYHAIDTLLASKLIYDKTPLNRDQLKAEVVQRVGEIWNRLNADGYDQR